MTYIFVCYISGRAEKSFKTLRVPLSSYLCAMYGTKEGSNRVIAIEENIVRLTIT